MKARSIEQAAKLVGLRCTEERSHLRALWPACKRRPTSYRVGYAPKGMMNGYVAVPIRFPTGELNGYIRITEAKLSKEFTFPRWSHFPRRLPRSAFSWFESYQAASASLYDQVWMTGWRLTSSIPAMVRSLSSRFDVTRMWRRTERANLEKKPSTRFSHEPCLGVKVNWKRPGGRASSQALVSLDMCAE